MTWDDHGWMDAAWLEVATRCAQTPAGREHLRLEQQEADLFGQPAAVARLHGALLRGETVRAELSEAGRRDCVLRPRALLPVEAAEVAEQFGVGHEQVLRDHAISHALAALSTVEGAGSTDGELVFFGGTALSRTILPTLRLSEDIDLLSHAPRRDMAETIERVLGQRLRRPLGALTWVGPSLRQVDGTEAAVAQFGGVQVRIQLLSAAAFPAWPLRVRRLHQRYSDAPPSALCTLSTPAFVASKLSAWHDRRAPRDLYDLWALGTAGHFDRDAVRLFVRCGPTGSATVSFTPPPDEDTWEVSLAHQGRVRLGAAEAARLVDRMWQRNVNHL